MKKLAWALSLAFGLLFSAAAGAQNYPCPQTIAPKIVPDATYKVTTGDMCWLIILTNAGDVTVKLPSPGLIFPPGFKTTILPINGATVTLTGLPDDAGNIHKVNGQTTLTLAQGAGAVMQIQQDVNWYALPTGGISFPAIPDADLLGGATGAFTQVTVGSGLLLSGGVLSSGCGTGTLNTVMKFTSTTACGDSHIVDDGTNIVARPGANGHFNVTIPNASGDGGMRFLTGGGRSSGDGGGNFNALLGSGNGVAADGGTFTLTAGNGGTSGNGGSVTLIAGGATDGNSGGYALSTGDVATSGNVGGFTFTAGSTASGNGGGFAINLGLGADGGTDGQFKIAGAPTTDPGISDAVYSANGVLIFSGHLPPSQRLAIGWDAALDPGAAGAENVIGTVDEASTVRSIIGTVSTPVGTAATVSVYKAPSGTACSAGTVLHSGSFNANGVGATNQTLTLTTTALSAGDRLCLVSTDGANWTGGAGVGGLTVRITTP